jgi:uncharacterized protein YqgV (UPF0045/DUF77 family)
MSHFAKVENGLVVQVIVAEQDFISTGALGDPASWIQTSYNTRGNVHYDQNGNVDAEGVRGNYAGIGYTYDSVNDVFVAPQPSADHILDTATWLWWNPTATDPVETKPVKATIPVVVVEEVVAPVVEPVVEAVEEVPAEVVETPVETVVEVSAEAVVETPVEAVEAVAETPAEEVAPVETPVNPV